MSISVEALLEKARQESGLCDFGDDWFKGPLGAYVSDLDGTHLSGFGKDFLARQAVKDLRRRLAIVDCLKRNPEIEDTPIPPILYITGHERSGTTLLHNLLSLHQGARFLSRWELMSPTPPPQAADFENNPRRLEVKKSIDALRGTDLEKMHWVEADDPEECVWGFMDCTGIVGMAPGLILPNWNNWLGSNDLTRTLVNYRKLIQLLTWKNPVPEDGFLVLKAPQMATHLEQLMRVFPEARFLYLHRDPYRVLTSFCTLVDIVNGPFLKTQDYQLKLDRDNSRCLNRMGGVYNHMAQFESAHADLVMNLQYVSLLDEPVEEITRIYKQSDHDADPALAGKIRDFLKQQQSGGRAKPRQQIVDHGYTRKRVESHPDLADYLQRYRVLLEPTRNTGTV